MDTGSQWDASDIGSRSAAPQDFARLNLIGESESFQRVLRLVERLSRCDATALIHGETGTGKELVARAIHYLSVRRTCPFIPVNCGAIPDSLVENELFGHARGAYTDAKDARSGVIAQAQSGTLFLDEIDALSTRSQVALLRFLQDREYKPVGGSVVRSADVRVVASTNANLELLVSKGLYRQDLFYRLDVLSVRLPPLRERPGDPRLLAEAFVRRFSRQYNTGLKTLDPLTLAYLDSHHWPGNVRELENLIHREFLLSDSSLIRIHSPATRLAVEAACDKLTATAFKQAKARVIAEFERAYITELLSRTQGNISQAARIAGKERSRLGKLVKKYGMERDTFTRDL